MQALFRSWDGKYYVWKDVTWKNGSFYYSDKETGFEFNLNETMFLAIKDDNRANKVVCKYCGEIIENTKEAIEKHFTDREAKKDCLTCSKVGPFNSSSNVKTVYENNGDGSYKETRTTNVRLRCKMSVWETVEIDSSKASKICQYNQCRAQGVAQIEDFFTKYPNAFNTQITVDLLNKRGYEYEAYSDGYFRYDCKLRNALKANVNELGVIDHFTIFHRDYRFTAWYSAEYDKLFFEARGVYTDVMPSRMSENKYNNVKSRIKALYEEARK